MSHLNPRPRVHIWIHICSIQRLSPTERQNVRINAGADVRVKAMEIFELAGTLRYLIGGREAWDNYLEII